MAEESQGEFTRSGCQPTGKWSPVSRPCLMGQRVWGECCLSSLTSPRQPSLHGLSQDDVDEPGIPHVHSGAAIGGERLVDNHHLLDSVESVTGNMGELIRDVKESERRAGKSIPKSSEVRVGSQRGHSSRRAGKPRTGRRATAHEVPQSTTLPNAKPGDPGRCRQKETRVNGLGGGRRVR